MKWYGVWMYIAGIDEVGRGPLAGPVSIGVAWVKEGVPIKKLFPMVTDSKALTEKRRIAVYEAIRRSEDISYTVVSVPASVIDEKGISFAISSAITKGCLKLPKETFVYLDGRLSAPSAFQQETVIKGDLKIPIISVASIMAKVERDRYMEKIAGDYPEYGFEKHKGYGTKAHQQAIIEHGLSEVHRESFCRNLLGAS